MNDQSDWMERRDLGIERAEGKALRELGAEWTERAARFLSLYANGVEHPFMLEDARVSAPDTVGAPSNPKAWGAAVQYAAKRGWIRRIGYSPAKSSNGSPKCLWVGAWGAQTPRAILPLRTPS
jgi:hypothetical protein